jgi:hypothetical protein
MKLNLEKHGGKFVSWIFVSKYNLLMGFVKTVMGVQVP